EIVEIFVGQLPDFARLGLPLPDQRDLVTASGLDMPVEAVDRGVELTAQEPLGVRWLPFEHAGPGAGPFQLAGPVRPVALPVLTGPAIQGVVLNVRGPGKR